MVTKLCKRLKKLTCGL